MAYSKISLTSMVYAVDLIVSLNKVQHSSGFVYSSSNTYVYSMIEYYLTESPKYL